MSYVLSRKYVKSFFTTNNLRYVFLNKNLRNVFKNQPQREVKSLLRKICNPYLSFIDFNSKQFRYMRNCFFSKSITTPKESL